MKRSPFLAAVCLLCAPMLRAQELKPQPIPFTAWLDFHASAGGAARGVMPIWLEKMETHKLQAADGSVEKTVCRLRFRRFAGLNDEMLLRLFFTDGPQPSVSAWSEIGTRIAAPRELGQGLGLPASETLVLPMSGVDYVDIETPGDGANLRGVFLSSLQKSETRSALDFSPASALADPFSDAPASAPAFDDALLFGRVKATLEPGVVTLNETNGESGVFQFDLAAPPLVALVTFEIENADIAAPPEVLANDQSLGRAGIVLPDLADPAYVGGVHPAGVAFRYSGWLRCQKLIPAAALLSGANRLQITSSAGGVAVRAVEVQLRYTTDTP